MSFHGLERITGPEAQRRAAKGVAAKLVVRVLGIKGSGEGIGQLVLAQCAEPPEDGKRVVAGGIAPIPPELGAVPAILAHSDELLDERLVGGTFCFHFFFLGFGFKTFSPAAYAWSWRGVCRGQTEL